MLMCQFWCLLMYSIWQIITFYTKILYRPDSYVTLNETHRDRNKPHNLNRFSFLELKPSKSIKSSFSAIYAVILIMSHNTLNVDMQLNCKFISGILHACYLHATWNRQYTRTGSIVRQIDIKSTNKPFFQ